MLVTKLHPLQKVHSSLGGGSLAARVFIATLFII